LLQRGDLTRLSVGIFVLHAIMAALFVALPLQLLALGVARDEHGGLYLPVLVLSAVLMMPLLRRAEQKQQQKTYLLMMIALLAVALITAAVAQQLSILAGALLLFFVAFNWLEACLPSWVSRVVPASSKGTAMGFYTSAQFFGAFAGAACAGALYSRWGATAVYLTAVVLLLVWWCLALSMAPMHGAAPPQEDLARLQGLEADSDLVQIDESSRRQ
jgi:MFS family permease